MRTRSRAIQQHSGYQLWEIGRDRLEELTDFVFSVYYRRFDSSAWVEAADDLQHMLDDDLLYADFAQVFAAVAPSGAILSTARAIEAVDLPLPIERDFGVSVATAAGERSAEQRTRRIFEIARLATSSPTIRNEQISAHAIPAITDAVVCQLVRVTTAEPGNFWVASMDVRALGLFRNRGFCFEDVGATDPNYIGSPTTPVILSMDAFRSEMMSTGQDQYAQYFEAGVSLGAHPHPSQRATSQLSLPSVSRGVVPVPRSLPVGVASTASLGPRAMQPRLRRA